MAITKQGLKPDALLRHETYRIERMLGQGGFGITYLATDLTLERLVAIKEFFPKDYCDREVSTSHVTLGTRSASEFVNKLKTKFLKEARNIAKFDHPGIIKIHAAFEENNTAYYVMDYIEGESLSEMVRQTGPLSPKKALEYIRKVGKALEYVHSKHINHLDIKPANIAVRRGDDNPILIDFGLSKQYDSEGNQTSTTPVGISHGFAPIEQYRDGGVREFSPQTDLYSLAATLYYLLTGTVPPQASALVEDELTFPPTFPPGLEKPISKAMSSARKGRQDNIEAFIDELTAAVKVTDASSASFHKGTGQDSEATQFSPEKYHHGQPLGAGKKNTISENESSDIDSDENNDKVPIYKKKWFIIVCAIIFVIGLLEFCWASGYIESLMGVSNNTGSVTEETSNEPRLSGGEICLMAHRNLIQRSFLVIQ